jgi:hypothetical protein
MESQFDAVAVNAWVDLCREESAMRANGMSEIDAFPMRMRVIVEMVNLLQNLTEEEKSSLVLFLVSQNLPPITGEGQQEVDHEDPSPSMGEQTSQTTEQADQPSQDPP